MTVLAGTGAVNPDTVMSYIGGIKLPVEDPAAVAEPAPQSAPQSVPQPVPQPVKAPEQKPIVEVPTFTEEPVEDEQPSTPAQDAAQPDEDSDLPDTPAAENFKKLRTAIKTERQLKKELETKLQEASERLTKYESGEVVPDVIREKDMRIQQLEPYEKIVNLKMSREYQESFVKPAIQLREKLEQLGADYALPKEVMHRAVELTNRKDLNTFLARHFDDVGALEVKQVIDQLHTLGEKAIEAEKEPETALQGLRSQFLEQEENHRRERATVFETVAKDAWGAALEKTKSEGVYKELILHPTDTEFNKKVVEPIQHRAAIQYSALIKELNANGLKTLPQSLAVGLARMVQLSIGGALSLEAKVAAEQERNAMKSNIQRTSGYIRPTIGGQNGSTHSARAGQSQTPKSPQEAAAAAARYFNK